MARLDAALRRVVLDDAELAAGCLLATRPQDPVLRSPEGAQARHALERAGLLADEKLLPWVAELLAIVAAPDLRVLVETQVGAAVAVPASGWVRDVRGVWGETTVEGATQVSAIEPSHLPWGVARVVGLAERPAPPVGRAFTVSLEALSAADATLGHPGETILDAGDRPDDDDHRALMTLLAARRLSWRLTLARYADDAIATSTLAVVDAAHEGLWLVEQADDEPSVVTLRPTDRTTLEELIFALFLTQSAAADARPGRRPPRHGESAPW